eukprot:5505976-Alexandrium_andersonii.AAC.1
MSASLVGSEMCIRDSPWLRRLPISWSSRSRALGIVEILANAMYREAAVSYTHLTLPTICSV